MESPPWRGFRGVLGQGPRIARNCDGFAKMAPGAGTDENRQPPASEAMKRLRPWEPEFLAMG